MDLEQEDPSADPAFGPMLDRMKLSTHQYAKSQVKWIRKQLLPAVREAKSLGGEVEVYVVQGGEAGHEPAARLLSCTPHTLSTGLNCALIESSFSVAR